MTHLIVNGPLDVGVVINTMVYLILHYTNGKVKINIMLRLTNGCASVVEENKTSLK